MICNTRTTSLGLSAMMIVTIVTAWTPVAAAGDEQCNNYGIQQQTSVGGDNTYTCQAQYCAVGPAGSGAAGVGVGTAGGKGEAGAQASAGTNCGQHQNGTSDHQDVERGSGLLALI